MIILSSGCSLSRRISTQEIPAIALTDSVVKDILTQNLTSEGFFIEKAEVEVVTEEGKEKFIATIKFRKPDTYLISIKSKTGIEGARIFADGDSIKVNDRINKRFYFGTSIYLKRKYGITQGVLPLLFGDLIVESRCITGNELCNGDKLFLNCTVRGIRMNYTLNCKSRKAAVVDQTDEGVKINYGKYIRAGNILIPGMIDFTDTKYNTTVKIKIEKVVFPWNGIINFIPGRDYELIELV